MISLVSWIFLGDLCESTGSRVSQAYDTGFFQEVGCEEKKSEHMVAYGVVYQGKTLLG